MTSIRRVCAGDRLHLYDVDMHSFSVISYNVLLPNSQDGWWIYKYYASGTDVEVTTWPYRQEMLRAQLLSFDADIICLQECSAESFEADFAFLTLAGYESELMPKGRMRNATFWKRDKVSLVGSALHKDRSLITQFSCVSTNSSISPHETDNHTAPVEAQSAAPIRAESDTLPIQEPNAAPIGPSSHTVPIVTTSESMALNGATNSITQISVPRTFFVVNVHLVAGPDASRRLRQMHDSLETVRKTVQKAAATENSGKMKLNSDELDVVARSSPVVVCGDFNSHGRSGVCELLTNGIVGAEFRESNDSGVVNDSPVTSKTKRIKQSLFVDAYESAYGEEGKTPATMVVASLVEHMIDQETGQISHKLDQAIREMFTRLSSDGTSMSISDIDQWLIKINGTASRGSEFRAAKKIVEEKKEAGSEQNLNLDNFISIYTAECNAGKYWGVQHDLSVINGSGLVSQSDDPFTMRIDHMMYTTGPLQCMAVAEPLTEEHRRDLFETKRNILPCEWHPSDHLPIAAVFAFQE